MSSRTSAKRTVCGVRKVVAAAAAGAPLELPMLPHVAAELISLCNRPDTDAARLCQVVHQDQALAGHVLRVANSPSYGASVPIVSLQQAIARLGLSHLGEIAMAVAVRGKVFAVQGPAGLVTQLWRHSVAVGCYAREIARLLKTNVETAFLCGLLHDVGKVVTLWAALDARDQLEHDPTLPELVEVMDEYHCRLGSRLATTWNLPPTVRDAIEHHHDYEAATEMGEQAAITCLADQLAHLVLAGCEGFEPQALRYHPVLSALNLYRGDVDLLLSLRETVADRVQAIG